MTASTTDADGIRAAAADFTWMVSRFAAETAGVVDAIAVSSDGLLIAVSRPGDQADSERLAAIVSGITSLAMGAAGNYGLGALNKVIIDMAGDVQDDWNCLEFFGPQLIHAGAVLLWTFLHTGQVRHVETMMVPLGGIGHLILIFACLTALVNQTTGTRKWWKFLVGGLLVLGISPLLSLSPGRVETWTSKGHCNLHSRPCRAERRCPGSPDEA